ncbi:MAG TPA: DUF4339 domain-containing protein [Phycisphaerae bacterium]|nr:DUF4339 domain-containing protein [Phycisphaerae bacterium]
MTNAPDGNILLPGQAASETAWYYTFNGQRMGPIAQGQLAGMLAGGQVGPDTPVWRQGMPQWLPAWQVEELKQFGSPAPPPMTSPIPASPPQDRKVKNAKQNCIAMFVIFVALAVLMVWALAVRLGAPSGSAPAAVGMGCIGWAAPFAAVFAAIYLPLRWRVIMQLSPAVRTLGLIGGFGLIAVMLLGLVGWLVLAAGG